MCECYKIGGPFIAEDPDCPIHGREAQQERDERRGFEHNAEQRMEALEEKVSRMGIVIAELEKMVQGMQAEKNGDNAKTGADTDNPSKRKSVRAPR